MRINDVEEALILTLTDGLNYCWIKKLGFSEFELLRNSMGISGSYKSFFKLLIASIIGNSFNLRKPKSTKMKMNISLKLS